MCRALPTVSTTNPQVWATCTLDMRTPTWQHAPSPLRPSCATVWPQEVCANACTAHKLPSHWRHNLEPSAAVSYRFPRKSCLSKSMMYFWYTDLSVSLIPVQHRRGRARGVRTSAKHDATRWGRSGGINTTLFTVKSEALGLTQGLSPTPPNRIPNGYLMRGYALLAQAVPQVLGQERVSDKAD